MPIQGWLGKLYNKYQLELLAAADERLTLSTEVISQVKIVKFFAYVSSHPLYVAVRCTDSLVGGTDGSVNSSRRWMPSARRNSLLCGVER
jgi:hypothetical protein